MYPFWVHVLYCIFADMAYRTRRGKQMSVIIDPEFLALMKAMHMEYRRATGLSVSFNKFIAGILAKYMGSDEGKKLLAGVYKVSEGS